MEENVALCPENQKHFMKSIQGIKKLIKAKKPTVGDNSKTVKHGYIKKKKPKGLVYLSHIPHGFYEHEMTEYFKQFGVVTNARVIKSKKTGRSKGHAFVEFKEPAVAQIVAETMNNYLMGKRLIKASYIPPEKQRPKAFRKHWNPINNPGNNLRKKLKKAYNQNKDEEGELKTAKKILSNLTKTKKKLRDIGINYDFFQPVDIPQILINQVKVENEPSQEYEKVEPDMKRNTNKQESEYKIKLKVKDVDFNTNNFDQLEKVGNMRKSEKRVNTANTVKTIETKNIKSKDKSKLEHDDNKPLVLRPSKPGKKTLKVKKETFGGIKKKTRKT